MQETRTDAIAIPLLLLSIMTKKFRFDYCTHVQFIFYLIYNVVDLNVDRQCMNSTIQHRLPNLSRIITNTTHSCGNSLYWF